MSASPSNPSRDYLASPHIFIDPELERQLELELQLELEPSAFPP